MATLYSSLYGTPPNAESATPIYRGPHGHMSKGGVYVVRGTLTIPAADFVIGDVMKFAKVPESVRLLRAVILPSADLDTDNDFTFDLGWVSDQDAFDAADTGLQAGTVYALAESATVGFVASGADGDEIILTGIAGEIEAAGSLTFSFELAQD